ncbi:preprotein translocase subunit SecF [Lysobacter antibioticus]|jgi:preprotein translocase subunit SecF|uniref:Protein-export membrane protein SecF n=1 Tax=Lysobacter antibioticus TaxID=84531 RepID=A0A0S2F8U6_LYSAN|nr:protein translocase subunit SecF [Lysobacter antibioticus]ALN64074.1 preprotein translocase subunit SecF [Lysobacter antibioticus]ALN79958.1 protein-export membrane protein SecF [Lysobacter antibioticus]
MKIFPLTLLPNDANINFMKLRWVSIAVAALIMFVAIGAMFTRNFNFALDFTGGNLVEVHLDKAIPLDQVRERLAVDGYDSAQVQTYGSGTELLIRLQPREGDASASATAHAAAAVMKAVSGEGNNAKILRNEFVGPQVGKELALNGLYALIFVIVGFLIYIAFRFEWKFAVAAIITTLHDVIVVAGWFAISGHEFDLTVLAGILSVMGYSINDTIVVFDRVRENFRSMRADPETILNKSINQTLSRTVITSFVAFLTVVALYIYGGGSLRGMAESQMLGIIIGTLSSIFVACPLLTLGILKVSKQDLLPKAKDEAALARRP